MLTVTDLSKRFHRHEVLRDVSISLRPGEVVGLIGRSGVGKSTLARCLVGLAQPDSGMIMLNQTAITPGRGSARQAIQYLWQDPSQSLSPYLSARGAVLETLNGFGFTGNRASRAHALLSDLGITPTMQSRRPHALSGGQCQRVALARALAADPQVLILDEPLSALDLPTQLQTIALLQDIHRKTGLTMLIVTHDLAPLRQLVSRILVLEAGRIAQDLPMAHFSKAAANPLVKAYGKSVEKQNSLFLSDT